MTERWTAAPCSLHILIWCNCKREKKQDSLKTLQVSDSNPPPAWQRLYAWTFASANNILCWFGLGQCRHCPPAGWSPAKNSSSSSSSYKRDAAERGIHAASGIQRRLIFVYGRRRNTSCWNWQWPLHFLRHKERSTGRTASKSDAKSLRVERSVSLTQNKRRPQHQRFNELLPPSPLWHVLTRCRPDQEEKPRRGFHTSCTQENRWGVGHYRRLPN